MKPLPALFQYLIKVSKLKVMHTLPVRFAMLTLLLLSAGKVSAQTVSWSDSFIQGQAPTAEQCHNWTNFLDQLGGKTFVSVTISGTFDETGKTINDPAAATALAALLYARTPGTVHSGNHHWTVTQCFQGACGSLSTALSVDGNQSECDCADKYSLRPHSTNEDWGGVNVASSCKAPSQTMRLVFNSGATITASGPTTLCQGSSVVLTASSVCTPPLTYLWSNGATTESINVSQPGNYSVTVSGADGCTGTSESIQVTQTDVAVAATVSGDFCTEPVQLNATGTSAGGSGTMVNEVCLYNSPGGAGLDDCTFTSDVCLEGATFVGNSVYSSNVSFSNAVELRFHLYYSAFANTTTFRFKLNNQELGSYVETDASGACETKGEGKFPRSFTFSESQFKQYWVDGGANELRVEIETAQNGIYLAGITSEVITSNETYSWSPIAGLSNASIKNPLASPTATTTYTVTYKDANGCVATTDVEVKVKCTNSNPVAVCKELNKELTTECLAEVEASAFDGGSTSTSGGQLTFSAFPAGPYPVGITNVVLTVTDSNGGSSTCTTKITVTDPVLPAIASPDDVVVNNDAATCSAKITLAAPVATDNCGIESVVNDQTDDIFPVGETIVTWTAKDVNGNLNTVTQKVTVTNVNPVINSVEAWPSTVALSAPVKLTTSYTDNNISKAVIDWGDLSATQTINAPSAVFEASHAYANPGSYSITVTLTDECSASQTYVYRQITVYDQGGYVRGDGWFNSLPGYYVKDKRASGKAEFHIKAEYKKGSSVPTGSVTFKFKDAKIDFKSTQLDWLFVQGDKATVIGAGKMNGTKGYSILMSAVDVDASKDAHKQKKKRDQIRVKIADPSGRVIYDTQIGDSDDAIATTEIGGGSIDIRVSKPDFTDILQEIIDSYLGQETASVYPNPFTDFMNIQYNARSNDDLLIQLMDLAGHVVASQSYEVSDDGNYPMDVPEGAREGIYIIVIKQGQHVEYARVVRK